MTPKTSEPQTPLKAILFDLDGTLIDSETNYVKTDLEFLRRRGIDLPEEAMHQFIGIGSEAFIAFTQETYGYLGDVAQMLEEKNQIYQELASRETRTFPEMLRFVEIAQAAGLLVAIASGSSLEIIYKCLTWGSIPYTFDLIISAEEVAQGKPAPDIFLEAARRLQVNPTECLVVEDSRPGTLSAKAAGMACVSVPFIPAEPEDQVFSQAEFYYPKGTHSFDAEDLKTQLQHQGYWPN